MIESIPALNRLVSIKDIAAAFVFNSKAEILAREVPPNYKDEGLKQIAQRVLNLNNSILALQTKTKELRLNFENYGLWIRCFSGSMDYYLVVFVEKEADLSILQQPINLAVLNLEKVVQAIEDEIERTASQSDLVKAAKEAEKSLYTTSGEDSNGLYAKLCLISVYLLGPIGDDLLLAGCRELDLRLPLVKLDQIRALINSCVEEIVDLKRKKDFLDQTEDVIQRMLLEKKIES